MASAVFLRLLSVDRPTEWVHNLVITEKRDGRMRVCLEPKPLDVAIKRERYEIPTPVDVQSRLSGMRVFTLIDMQYAYWHVKLSPESSYLCTFRAPCGRERFLRMYFGISSARACATTKCQVQCQHNPVQGQHSDLHGPHSLSQ